MGRQFITAGQGLLKVFFGQALSIAATALSTAALLFQMSVFLYFSAGVSLAGFILILIGLSGAAVAHPSYRSAMGCVVMNVGLNLLANLGWLASFYSILSLLDLVVGLLTAFLVCKTTASLLVEKGDERCARHGALVWKLYAFCVAGAAICRMLSAGSHGSVWAVALSGAALLMVVFAQCLYLWYLFSSQRALQR